MHFKLERFFLDVSQEVDVDGGENGNRVIWTQWGRSFAEVIVRCLQKRVEQLTFVISPDQALYVRTQEEKKIRELISKTLA